jgi:microcystin degradation protein MlrC
VQYGEPIFGAVEGANIPAAGAIQTLRALGHSMVGTAWGAASPSAHVTSEAFERITTELLSRLKQALPVDGVYLDLHGAMVVETCDDGEGEILRRVREAVGPRVPVVASLDLHANVTRAMFERADALVASRTYPHVDMAGNCVRAAFHRPDAARRRAPKGGFHQLDYLTGIPSQCSFIEPCKGIYGELARLEEKTGAVLSFTPGFPMADFADCGMAVFGYGSQEAVHRLRGAVADAEKDFAMELHDAPDAVRRAKAGEPGASWCSPTRRTTPRRRKWRYDRTAACLVEQKASMQCWYADRSALGAAPTKSGKEICRLRLRTVVHPGIRRSASSRWSAGDGASRAPGRCSKAFA